MTAPKLIGRPLASTLTTWQAWWQSDAAETWSPADVSAAERLIKLVDALNRDPANLKLHHEVRQGERRLRLSHITKTQRTFDKRQRDPLPQRPKMTAAEELAPLWE